jgi:hypothetical protein
MQTDTGLLPVLSLRLKRKPQEIEDPSFLKKRKPCPLEMGSEADSAASRLNVPGTMSYFSGEGLLEQ